MSVYELSILQFEAINVIDNGFETWMAATFGIVIVAHATGHNLDLKLRLFLAALYAACAILSYGRYDSLMEHIDHYHSLMSAQDFIIQNATTTKTVALIRKGIMVIGSIGALSILLIPRVYSRKPPANV